MWLIRPGMVVDGSRLLTIGLFDEIDEKDTGLAEATKPCPLVRAFGSTPNTTADVAPKDACLFAGGPRRRRSRSVRFVGHEPREAAAPVEGGTGRQRLGDDPGAASSRPADGRRREPAMNLADTSAVAVAARRGSGVRRAVTGREPWRFKLFPARADSIRQFGRADPQDRLGGASGEQNRERRADYAVVTECDGHIPALQLGPLSELVHDFEVDEVPS